MMGHSLELHTPHFRPPPVGVSVIDAFDSTTMSILAAVTTKRQFAQCPASIRESVNYEQQRFRGRRCISDHGHFYRNRQLELYAAKEARRLTLRQLVRSPKPLRDSSPPAHSPNMKRNFLGLVWPLYDRRPVDHSERRSPPHLGPS